MAFPSARASPRRRHPSLRYFRRFPVQVAVIFSTSHEEVAES